MARRRFARILAPLALIAVIVAIFLVVSSTLREDGGDDSGGSGTATTQTDASGDGGADEPTKPKKKRKQPTTYTVQAGDILSTVSEQTGVSVEELQELNPDVDPQALQVGEVLKLTPNADTDDAAADDEAEDADGDGVPDVSTTTTTP